MSSNQIPHCGVFVALKNYIESKKIEVELLECCIACQILLISEPVQIMCFYNHPKYSSFRYSNENYTILIGTFPGKTPTVICGDLKFPTTNWTLLNSYDDEEQTFLDLVEANLYQQAVNFPARATNILDVVFFKNCIFYACEDLKFSRIYNCTDHKPIKVTLEIGNKDPKAAIKNFHSFGSGGYEEMLIDMSINKYQPVCHTNINNTCVELHDYFDIFIQKHIPQRTKRRQQLPPSIMPSTSNLMKKLKTQRELLNKKPSNYRKLKVTKLENLVTEFCETIVSPIKKKF